jgi:hypothetical protein
MAKIPATAPKSTTAKPEAAGAAEPKVKTKKLRDKAKDVAPNQFRFKALVDQLVEKTGCKQKDVRELALLTLGAIGGALARGEVVNLPEFGKARVSRQSETADGGSLLVINLRRGGNAGEANAGYGTGGADKAALAEDDE